MDVFKNDVIDMQTLLQKSAFFYLNQIMAQSERSEIYMDIEKVFEKAHKMDSCAYLRIRKFFKSQEKLDDFKKFYFNSDSPLNDLKKNVFAAAHYRPKEQIKGYAVGEEQQKKLCQEGMELYRGKDAILYGIAINFCNPEQLAIALEKGSREIIIHSALQYRERTVDGVHLIDPELEDWDKMLNRFEEPSKENDDKLRCAPVDAAIAKLKKIIPSKPEFAFSNMDPVSLIEWNHRNAEEYYRVRRDKEHNFCLILRTSSK